MKLFLRMYKSCSVNLWFYYMFWFNRYGVCSNWYEVGWWMICFLGVVGWELLWGWWWECLLGCWRISVLWSIWCILLWWIGRSVCYLWCLSMDFGILFLKVFCILVNLFSSVFVFFFCSLWLIVVFRFFKCLFWWVFSFLSFWFLIFCFGEF